jgi:hypothetical protein
MPCASSRLKCGESENAWHECLHIATAAACASATLASTVALAAAATASAAAASARAEASVASAAGGCRRQAARNVAYVAASPDSVAITSLTTADQSDSSDGVTEPTGDGAMPRGRAGRRRESARGLTSQLQSAVDASSCPAHDGGARDERPVSATKDREPHHDVGAGGAPHED